MGDQAITSLSSALSSLQVSSRKPELPPFDKNSIDKWIRRVESAYIRSGITAPVEKFAFIESKFPVDEDPAVDEFLFGDPTEENWQALCSYLRQRHGKTKKQKVAAILEPMHMDGRTPSQYYAKLKQNYGDITLDDIVKEICVRQLPVDLQQTMCKDTEDLSAKDMMKHADRYFNPDGSRIHKKEPTVNAVKAPANSTTFSQPFVDKDTDDNNTDINAVRGRDNNQRGRQNGNGFDGGRSQSRGRFNNNNNGGYRGGNRNSGGSSGNNNNNNGPGRNNNNNQQQNDPQLCFYHNMYGDKAKKCDIGCKKSNQGNGLRPRQ